MKKEILYLLPKEETILKFKEKYPFKFMKKLFLKKDSNLRKHFKTFNFTK